MSTELAPLSLLDDSFCLAVVEFEGNLGAAYRAVFGDNAVSPTAKARELLCRPEIAKRVNQLSRAVDEDALISLGSHLSALARLRDEAARMGQIKAAVTAEVKRGEAAGLYAKHLPKGAADDINGRPSVTINIGNTPVSIEEWSKKYGPQSTEIVDVTPKQ